MSTDLDALEKAEQEEMERDAMKARNMEAIRYDLFELTTFYGSNTRALICKTSVYADSQEEALEQIDATADDYQEGAYFLLNLKSLDYTQVEIKRQKHIAVRR